MPKKYTSPLRRREFRLYFAGNLVSNVGNWVNNVVLAVSMHEQTRSSAWVGVVGFGLFFPVLVLSLRVGAIADRVDRLRLLRFSQLWSGGFAIALTILSAAGLADRVVLAVISFGLGIGIAVSIPAMQSMIPQLVPPDGLGDAIRLNGLSFNLARVVGPLFAAAALATVGITWAFALNALTFFVLAGALTLIGNVPFPTAGGPVGGTVREGLSYAWHAPGVRWLLVAIVAIAISLDPITTLSPALADHLGWGSDAAGWIVTAWGAGAVAMLLAGRRLIAGAVAHGLGWMGLVALAMGIAGLGLAPTMVLAFVAAAVAGVGYITATMTFTTTLQAVVPDGLRGRMAALWTLAFLGPRSIVAVVDGRLADLIGARASAVVFASTALFAAGMLRRVLGLRVEPVVPQA